MDIRKHLGVFDPSSWFAPIHVHVSNGNSCTGERLIMELAKLGFEQTLSTNLSYKEVEQITTYTGKKNIVCGYYLKTSDSVVFEVGGKSDSKSDLLIIRLENGVIQSKLGLSPREFAETEPAEWVVDPVGSAVWSFLSWNLKGFQVLSPYKNYSYMTPVAGYKLPLPIHCIGAGSIGSRVALKMAKLYGGQNLHVYDFDRIEGVNIPNQIYGMNMEGQYKVDALLGIIYEETGTHIHIHKDRLEDGSHLQGTVMVPVDNMVTRRKIWETIDREKVPVFLDGRMGSKAFDTFKLIPQDTYHCGKYSSCEFLFPDSQVRDEEVGGCGLTPSIGATAEWCASWLVALAHQEKYWGFEVNCDTGTVTSIS